MVVHILLSKKKIGIFNKNYIFDDIKFFYIIITNLTVNYYYNIYIESKNIISVRKIIILMLFGCTKNGRCI